MSPLLLEEFLKLPSPALKECFPENNEVNKSLFDF